MINWWQRILRALGVALAIGLVVALLGYISGVFPEFGKFFLFFFLVGLIGMGAFELSVTFPATARVVITTIAIVLSLFAGLFFFRMLFPETFNRIGREKQKIDIDGSRNKPVGGDADQAKLKFNEMNEKQKRNNLSG